MYKKIYRRRGCAAHKYGAILKMILMRLSDIIWCTQGCVFAQSELSSFSASSSSAFCIL